MKTGTQTTYILLDRGSEDKAMRHELDRILWRTYEGDIMKFFKELPVLAAIYQELCDEVGFAMASRIPDYKIKEIKHQNFT
jgi:hypothetical protein